MSKSEAEKNAARFLKEQAAIIRKHGEAPKLSGPLYKEALTGTAKAFQSLSSAKKSGE